MEVRTVQIHQSLHRHNLVMGGERELVMFSALIALLVGVGGMKFISFVTAGIFWLCAIFVLRSMAKADPQMYRVWMRHIKQIKYYSARSSAWREMPGYKVRS